MKLKQLFKQTPSDLFWNFLAMCGYRKVMDLEGLVKSYDQDDPWMVGANWGKYHPDNLKCWWRKPRIIDGKILFFPIREPLVSEAHEVIPYSVGKINTYPFKQKYGYWEINCNISLQEALRHAFWGWADSDDRPKPINMYREIDFFEIDSLQGKQKINVHYGTRKNSKSQMIGPINLNTVKPGKMQRFGFNWDETKMEWYVDNSRVFRLTNKKILRWFNENETAIWTLISQDVIGELGPEYGRMIVDYVALYKLER